MTLGLIILHDCEELLIFLQTSLHNVLSHILVRVAKFVVEVVIGLHLLQNRHLLDHLLSQTFLLSCVENLDLNIVLFFLVKSHCFQNFLPADFLEFRHD